MLEKNKTYTLTVDTLNNLGFGVARHKGQVVFVSGALPGEEVVVKVLKVTKSYAVAKAETILKPSPYRIEDPCHAKGCGGCVYGSTCYEEELRIKREGVKDSFARHGIKDAEVAEVVSVGEIYHYRNKAQYPVAQNKDGSCRIGFFAPHSHRVVEARDCLLQPIEFQKILEIIGGFVEKHKISIYNEEQHKGLLRHIYLRKSQENGEVLLVLVVNGNAFPHAEKLVDALLQAGVKLAGVLLSENRERTNVVLGDVYHLLWGKKYIEDTLCAVKLKLSAPAFYQVNHAATEVLYGIAAQQADLKGDELLLDLYCGVGSIGLSMAHKVKELIGVEIVPDAIRCAKENALACGITNASFYCADATDTEQILACAQAQRGAPILPDVVILDPPRKGCDAKLLSYIASLSPTKIVYISCNPDTLARDCRLLTDLGYTLGTVTPVNLFPRTSHVESVVCLKRQIQQ